MEFIKIPYIQVRPRGHVIYHLFEPPPAPPPPKPIATYTGKMTQSAVKRIRRVCGIMLMRSPERTVWNPVTNRPIKFRMTFVTLTISQTENVAAPDAYTLGLAPFLRWLRSKKGVSDYIWKCELQQRGQVHYHITTNQFIRHDEIRTEWNEIQKAAGWLNDYNRKYGGWNPNSTDIHSVKKADKIDLYLAKYLSKGNGKEAIKGKVWGCSKTLSGKKYYTTILESETQSRIEEAQRSGQMQVKRLEHVTVTECAKPEQYLDSKGQAEFQQWLK